jgi:hypothetical protein
VNGLICGQSYFDVTLLHRLNINRATKRGKEKSPEDGHCQCQKEMDDHNTRVLTIFDREPYSDPLC